MCLNCLESVLYYTLLLVIGLCQCAIAGTQHTIVSIKWN